MNEKTLNIHVYIYKSHNQKMSILGEYEAWN